MKKIIIILIICLIAGNYFCKYYYHKIGYLFVNNNIYSSIFKNLSDKDFVYYFENQYKREPIQTWGYGKQDPFDYRIVVTRYECSDSSLLIDNVLHDATNTPKHGTNPYFKFPTGYYSLPENFEYIVNAKAVRKINNIAINIWGDSITTLKKENFIIYSLILDSFSISLDRLDSSDIFINMHTPKFSRRSAEIMFLKKNHWLYNIILTSNFNLPMEKNMLSEVINSD